MNFMIPFGTLEIACAGSLAMFLAELSGLFAAATSDFLNSSVFETSCSRAIASISFSR